MKSFTNNELQIINRFNTYKAWAKEQLISRNRSYYAGYIFTQYPEMLEEDLCGVSERYASLVKIEAIIAKPGFEAKLHAYGDKLQCKCCRLFDKLSEEIDKSSCHWKREGYDSRDEYREYLWSSTTYATTNGYYLNVTENLVSDLYCEVLNESFDFGY
jgi:hypothetical protein